ncbi:MAG: acyltransferase [Candidatus Liberibacter europaeus]|uniref:Acyltransferase n=1 Tax=Candidatus Liberibacter europaeus TaxID=744859 RepID=A0A2T4VWS7_9HYPH|nr:acyltransferase [Candidatus Liberibacter europaeus]PTL86231.1 MAG: acyltransferase [Candidatus Liberibacter europaeus]
MGHHNLYNMENNKRKDIISLIRFQLSYFKYCWWFFIGDLLSVIVSSIVVLTIPNMLRSVVHEEGTGLDISIVFFALAVATALRYYFSTMFGERIVLSMQRDFVAKIIKLSPSFFDSKNDCEIFSTLVKDADKIKTVIGVGLSSAFRSIVLFVSASYMMFRTNFYFTVIFILIICVIAILLMVIRKLVFKELVSIKFDANRLSTITSDVVRSAKMFQSFNAEEEILQRYNMQSENAYKCISQHILSRTYKSFFIIFVPSCAVSILLLLRYFHQIDVTMIPSEYWFSFMYYMFVALGGVRSGSIIFSGMSHAIDSAKRLRDFIECNLFIPAPIYSIQLPSKPLGSIVFHNVSFSYSGKSESYILKNINLTVHPGETIALVGLSGAGKTSILSLILRCYDPCSGFIELGGVNLLQIPLQDIRRYISCVPHNPIMINETLHDNIAIGLPNATREDVQRAAMIAQAHEFIICLDEGYDTVLCNNAVILSAGQIQRIAIARAIIRDPPILLLDELGATLDVENEMKIWNLLREHRKDRTTILVSHRLSVIHETDTVVVLQDGVILEKGLHNELINKSGFYSHLVGLQLPKTIC